MSDAGREPVVPREELEAVVRARQELSSEHDPELIESFLAEVGDAIDRRVDERVADVGPHRRQRSASVELAIASIALGIPVTAVAGSNAGSVGVAFAWIGIVILNLLVALSRRR
jgi:hypothetical protein